MGEGGAQRLGRAAAARVVGAPQVVPAM